MPGSVFAAIDLEAMIICFYNDPSVCPEPLLRFASFAAARIGLRRNRPHDPIQVSRCDPTTETSGDRWADSVRGRQAESMKTSGKAGLDRRLWINIWNYQKQTT